MTQRKSTPGHTDLKALAVQDQDFLRQIVRETVQQVLEAQDDRGVGRRAGRAYRGPAGIPCRPLPPYAGHPRRQTGAQGPPRPGRPLLELSSSNATNARRRRSRRCQINKGLDESLSQFAHRHLDEPYPYLILDARYERVREGGVIRGQAVLVASGISQEGYRQILGVELAGRESQTSWRDFLVALKERGLHGVEFVVSDDHQGLRKGIMEILPEAAWQRCYVHFLRNTLDHMPRKAKDDCLKGTPVAL